MEPLAVDEDVEASYSPSNWGLGLKGVARIQRCLHLIEVQNQHANLSELVTHVSYGPDEAQRLNVMRCDPHARSDETVLVFTHGGYWMEGNRDMFNYIAHGLHAHNITVVNLGYRLATVGSGLDCCVDDVVSGISKVQELFPMSKLYLAGHSAGGHLIMAALPRLPTIEGICKVFCVSGIYDLQPITATTVGVQIGFTPDQVVKFSICPHPRYDELELCLIVGEFDPPEFYKQADSFSKQMQHKGFHRPQIVILPGEDHFSLVENLFYQKAPLTLCFAGLYDANRRRVRAKL